MKLRALGALLALLLPGLVCAQTSTAPGTVTASPTAVSWTAPLLNTDGTQAVLGGYNLYLATSDAALTALPNVAGGTPICPAGGPYLNCAISITGAAALSYLLPALAPGLYVITVTAWEGSQESVQGPHAPFTVPAPYIPQCYPKVKLPPAMGSGSITAGVSTRYDSYSVWVCSTPTGYATVVSLFPSSSNVLQAAWAYVFGSWTATQAQADCAKTCVPPSGAEQAFMNSIGAQYGASALVTPNPPYKSRGVFAATPTGAVGAQVTTSRVAIGAVCNPALRLAGTNFYSVQGQPDIANPGQALGAVYAWCTVKLPVGAN